MTVERNASLTAVGWEFWRAVDAWPKCHQLQLAHVERHHADARNGHAFEPIHETAREHRVLAIRGNVRFGSIANLSARRATQSETERFDLAVEITVTDVSIHFSHQDPAAYVEECIIAPAIFARRQ